MWALPGLTGNQRTLRTLPALAGRASAMAPWLHALPFGGHRPGQCIRFCRQPSFAKVGPACPICRLRVGARGGLDKRLASKQPDRSRGNAVWN